MDSDNVDKPQTIKGRLMLIQAMEEAPVSPAPLIEIIVPCMSHTIAPSLQVTAGNNMGKFISEKYNGDESKQREFAKA